MATVKVGDYVQYKSTHSELEGEVIMCIGAVAIIRWDDGRRACEVIAIKDFDRNKKLSVILEVYDEQLDRIHGARGEEVEETVTGR